MMPAGNIPKRAGTAQRRNKLPPSHARLETTEQPRDKAPSLGKHPAGGKWHARTRTWWGEVWSSPMASEYLEADTEALRHLAVLNDLFWTKPSGALAAEIRMQRVAFGLTPLDRRRLQWEVVRTEEAEAKHQPQKPAPEPTGDPRDALRVV